MKTTEERYDIYDLIDTLHIKLWPDEEELELMGKTYMDWSTWLDHPPRVLSDGRIRGCQTCGFGASCILDVFYEAVIQTTILELDKLGLLK